MAGDLFLAGEVKVDRYSLIMEKIVGVALSPEQSRRLVEDLAAGMMEES